VVPGEDDLAIGTGRRLNVAVLFLDLSGFSVWPSETPAEQDLILRVFNLFFGEMIRIVEDYGGTVEKNTGDGLMAYFEDSAGNPPDADAKRAVACALTMMNANEQLINPILRASGVQEIHFRVGIDCGAVTIAEVGAAQRFHGLVAIGTRANVACKMLDVAKPDDILIGESVMRRLPPLWTQWCKLALFATGWTYRHNGLPYCFYRYTGRWSQPM
jgi:class 3 adenylate cyclase